MKIPTKQINRSSCSEGGLKGSWCLWGRGKRANGSVKEVEARKVWGLEKELDYTI